MPELRQNIATREWVIIATERAKRPQEFAGEKPGRTEHWPAHVASCPFCPGNEALSGASTWQSSVAGSWAVRVVRNKFPALDEDLEPERRFRGLERRMAGFGVHEVIIESPRHNVTTALQSDREVARTLYAFRDRGRELTGDPRILITVFFKNHGPSAGTSLEHPHSQMISMPVVPHHLRERLHDAVAWFDEFGDCVFCEMLRRELEEGCRIVVEGRHFAAFIPYAAYSPFHTWIVPRRHRALFVQSSDEEIEDLGRVLRATLARIYFGLHDPDFNFVIRTAPNGEEHSQAFHWYLSIVPKVTKLAGFEIGSGMFINTALPEDSARFLRGVEIPDGD